MPFFLVSFLDPETKEPICADPRGVLKKVIDRAEDQGWQCYAGCEYEVSSPACSIDLRVLTVFDPRSIQYFQFKGMFLLEAANTEVDQTSKQRHQSPLRRRSSWVYSL